MYFYINDNCTCLIYIVVEREQRSSDLGANIWTSGSKNIPNSSALSRHVIEDPHDHIVSTTLYSKSNMATQDVQAKVPELRKFFLDKFNGNILDDTYDERDVKRVKEDDAYLRNFLRIFKAKGDIKKCAEYLNKALLFRAKMKLNDLKVSDLNQEVKDMEANYYKGTDKQGHKILHFKVAKQKKGYLLEETKQNIAFNLNTYYKDNAEERIVLLFDFAGAGISNMDLDISEFIVNASSFYFPNVNEYSLMYKMSTPLEVIWKIIQSWMAPEDVDKTHFVSRSTIQKYIDESQLEPEMIKEEPVAKK